LAAIVVVIATLAGQSSAAAESWLGGGFAKGFWSRLRGASSADESFDPRNPPEMAIPQSGVVIAADMRLQRIPASADEVPLSVAFDRVGPDWD